MQGNLFCCYGAPFFSLPASSSLISNSTRCYFDPISILNDFIGYRFCFWVRIQWVYLKSECHLQGRWTSVTNATQTWLMKLRCSFTPTLLLAFHWFIELPILNKLPRCNKKEKILEWHFSPQKRAWNSFGMTDQIMGTKRWPLLGTRALCRVRSAAWDGSLVHRAGAEGPDYLGLGPAPPTHWREVRVIRGKLRLE